MTRKTSVLFYADLSEPFVPSDLEVRPLGGSETAIIHLAWGLARLGHEVIVAAHPGGEGGNYEGVAYADVADRLWRDREVDATIVFRQLPHARRPLPGRVRLLWAHDHIGIFPELPRGPTRSVLRLAWSLGYRLFGRHVPFIVTVSEWLRRCFVDFAGWPAESVWAVSNAINPELFVASARHNGRRNARVVYTSAPERGLALLVERVMPAVWQEMPDVELHVFSYRPLDRYAGLASANRGRIRFRGGLRHAELAQELASFDLWLYPTDFPETSCIAAMEAQAAGLPVVTSRRYALQETVLHGETGALVEGSVGTPAYVNRFAGAVVNLLKDPDRRRRMGARARERMLTEFTWDRVAVRWSELLEKFVNRES